MYTKKERYQIAIQIAKEELEIALRSNDEEYVAFLQGRIKELEVLLASC